MSVGKYLARYREPEARLAELIPEEYAALLVVPALGESPELIEGYRGAAKALRGGRLLVALVVNARANAAPELAARNHELLKAFERGRELPRARLFSDPDFDVLAIDRASRGNELPPKQGVGLARKIGMDLGLALYARGKLRSPWLFGTDADARLPPDYFSRVEQAPEGVSAVLYPFRHAGDASDPVTQATWRYEASLRYHVLGLASAGSAYAHHSVGSAIAVRAELYAGVRGVPKREAGEDFYLLDKLVKLAPLARLTGEPLELRARHSSRAPFGTGPGVSAVLEQGDALVPHPRSFARLREISDAIDELARTRDFPAFRALLANFEVYAFLHGLGMFEAYERAVREVGSGNLRRRLITWFDGQRTLRVLHALGAHGLPEIELARALDRAPFTPGCGGLETEALLERLTRFELALPALAGPALEE